MKRSLKSMFGQRFRAGSYATFAAVAVIAIAVMANVLVGALPSTLTEVDLTAQSLFSLSDQTRRIVSSLNKDVNMYLLATSGGEDVTIARLLERYEGLSDHIHVSCVDPMVQPAFLDEYELNLNTLYANSVLVECQEQYRLVSYSDIYVTNYYQDNTSYSGYSTTTEFDGEDALTNAIHYVSSDDLPVVYTMSGHGESELQEYVVQMLEQDNLQVESLSLLTMESIPEDADAIIINAPTTDLGEDEAVMLINWLQNGGRVALTTGLIDEEKMPNLLSVTAAMGLTVEPGMVVEGDRQMHLARYPHYLLPEISSHEITSALKDAGYFLLTPMAQPIVETYDAGASVSMLATTSSEAYTKLSGLESTTTEKEEGDAEGPFHVGAASELGEGRLVWFTSAEMLQEYVDGVVSYANSNAFLNAVNWMCDQEETISIRGKSLDTESLAVPSSQSSFWSIVLIGLVPAAFIALGVTVCVRRKRR